MDFEDWIDEIENFGTEVPGLEHCSLEHRRALRAAFEAGKKAQAEDDETSQFGF